jgi:hypothetical protein
VVLIASPPPAKTPSPLYRILASGSFVLRIFDPTQYGTRATTFRSYGPINRFDHQRLPPMGNCAEDPERGISYAGLTLSCCLVECFGDTGVIEIKGQQIGRIQLNRDLTLLDLRANCDFKHNLAEMDNLCLTSTSTLTEKIECPQACSTAFQFLQRHEIKGNQLP